MRFDPFALVHRLENRHPKAAFWLAMVLLGNISPFNAHLKTRLLRWDNRSCLIALRRIRRVRNHVGSIHAGALFTLGETCAGLVIIRNFPFKDYRPLMSDVQVNYAKQARGHVTGECVITDEEIAAARVVMETGEVPTLPLITRIRNADQEEIATVTTTWQVKPWSLVRTK